MDTFDKRVAVQLRRAERHLETKRARATYAAARKMADLVEPAGAVALPAAPTDKDLSFNGKTYDHFLHLSRRHPDVMVGFYLYMAAHSEPNTYKVELVDRFGHPDSKNGVEGRAYSEAHDVAAFLIEQRQSFQDALGGISGRVSFGGLQPSEQQKRRVLHTVAEFAATVKPEIANLSRGQYFHETGQRKKIAEARKDEEINAFVFHPFVWRDIAAVLKSTGGLDPTAAMKALVGLRLYGDRFIDAGQRSHDIALNIARASTPKDFVAAKSALLHSITEDLTHLGANDVLDRDNPSYSVLIAKMDILRETNPFVRSWDLARKPFDEAFFHRQYPQSLAEADTVAGLYNQYDALAATIRELGEKYPKETRPVFNEVANNLHSEKVDYVENIKKAAELRAATQATPVAEPETIAAPAIELAPASAEVTAASVPALADVKAHKPKRGWSIFGGPKNDRR